MGCADSSQDCYCSLDTTERVLPHHIEYVNEVGRSGTSYPGRHHNEFTGGVRRMDAQGCGSLEHTPSTA